MKKTLFIIIILFIISSFINIPKYIELNDLVIIDKIYIDCNNKIIKYREIIPYKDNNSINYKYKNYTYKYNEIHDFINKKNLYYNKNKIKLNLNTCKK